MMVPFGITLFAVIVNVVPITFTGEPGMNESWLGLPAASRILVLLLDMAMGVGSRPDCTVPVIFRVL